MRALCVLVLLLAGCLAEAPDRPDPVDAAALSCDPCALRVSTGGSLWEPHVLTDANDPSRIVAFVGDGGATFYRSLDGGATWTRHPYLHGSGAEPTSRQATWLGIGDPTLAWLPDGGLVAAGLGNLAVGGVGTPHRDVFVIRSDDAGMSWGEPVVVAEGGVVGAGPVAASYAIPDREFLAAGADGSLVLTWNHLVRESPSEAVTPYHSDLLLARSTDGGRTWSAPETVAASASAYGPNPVVLDDGTTLVAYGSFGQGGLHVASDRDGWQLAHFEDVAASPRLAAAGHRVALAYPAWEDEVQEPRLRVSDDGGRSWTGPLVLGAAGIETRVAVAWVGDEAWVAWYEAREDGNAIVAARVDPGQGIVATLDVQTGMAGSIGSYGDYVFGLEPAPGGATLTYVSGDADGRWLDHAFLHA